MGTNYGLSRMVAAEVRRGAIFHEGMDSVDEVLRNGGTIGSGARFIARGQGFSFNGSAGARISYKDVLRNPATAITFAARFKCSNAVATRMDILSQSTTKSNGIYITNGTLTFSINISGTARTVNATGAWNDGGWHYVVGTWASGAALRIYVDGYLNTTGGSTYSGTFQPDTADDELTIGANYNGAAEANNFSGQIKYADVFKASLDADEVLAYATGTMFDYDRFCVCDLPFSLATHDVSNKRSLDVSGNNAHATWGDGSTTTTFPTKLANSRGYSFDGGDYMRTPILPTAVMSAYILYSRNSAPATKSLFGCTDGGSPALIFALDDTVTTGIYKFYPRGVALNTDGLAGREIQSFMCETAGSTNRVIVNGQSIFNGVLVTNNLNNLGIAIGCKNSAGVYGGNITGNIYKFAIYQNYYLNRIQALDLDIRAKDNCFRCP